MADDLLIPAWTLTEKGLQKKIIYGTELISLGAGTQYALALAEDSAFRLICESFKADACGRQPSRVSLMQLLDEVCFYLLASSSG